MALRLVFMGTPDFAVPTLVALAGGGHEIAAVYTRAPRPAGRRGLELTPSPVAREAERLKLPILTPKTLRDAEAADRMHATTAGEAVSLTTRSWELATSRARSPEISSPATSPSSWRRRTKHTRRWVRTSSDDCTRRQSLMATAREFPRPRSGRAHWHRDACPDADHPSLRHQAPSGPYP